MSRVIGEVRAPQHSSKDSGSSKHDSKDKKEKRDKGSKKHSWDC